MTISPAFIHTFQAQHRKQQQQQHEHHYDGEEKFPSFPQLCHRIVNDREMLKNLLNCNQFDNI